MSTFAVFGMTLDVAIAEAKKTTLTTRADPKLGGGCENRPVDGRLDADRQAQR